MTSETVYGKTHCFVVSGEAVDPRGSLKDHPFSDSSIPTRTPCQRFDSFAELEKTVNQMKIKKTITSSDQLLIMGATHGEADGTLQCNAKDEFSTEVYRIVKTLSKTHRVGAVLTNCYSGDILKQKLLDDKKAPGSSIDNLCMITSSHFGLPTTSYNRNLFESIDQAQPGESLESVYKNSSGGMISSAAWDASGISSYIRKKDSIQATEILKRMNGLVEQSPCRLPQKTMESLQVCAMPAIDYKTLQRLNLLNATKNSTIFSDRIEEHKNNLRARIKDNNWDYITVAKSASCRAKIWEETLTWLDGISQTSGISISDFGYKYYSFTKSLLKNHSCITPQSPKNLMRRLLPKEWSSSTPLDHVPLAHRLDDHFEAINEIEKLLINDAEITDTISLVSHLTTASSKCQASKDGILSAILGETLLGHAIEDLPVRKVDFYADTEPAYLTQRALDAFVRGTIELPDYSDPVDKRRRKACTEFKF